MDISCTSEFDCTPDELWPWIAELDRLPRWMKGLESATSTQPGPLRVGSTFTMLIREGRRTAEYQAEVTAHERPRRLALVLRGGSFGDRPMHVEYRLEPTNSGTRLDYCARFEASGALKFFAPLFVWFARMQLKGFMKRLKQLAEEGRATLSAR